MPGTSLLAHLIHFLPLLLLLSTFNLAELATTASGAVFQAHLGNPLVDPFILGVSSSAALGIYLAMLAGRQATILGFMAMPLLAFMGGIVAVWLVYKITKVGSRVPFSGCDTEPDQTGLRVPNPGRSAPVNGKVQGFPGP